MTDRILLVGRHAEAKDSHSLGDKFRKLSDHGKSQALGNGLMLDQNGYIPDVIIHSDAIRIQETLAGIISIWPDAPKTISDGRIYQVPYGLTDANLVNFFERILAQADDGKACVMVLGHNPDIARYAEILSGGLPKAMKGEYPTATISVFRSSAESWALIAPENCILEGVILNGQRYIKADRQIPSAPRGPEAK